MNCERIEELILTDYLDGQLSAEQKKNIDVHLSRCPNCQAYLRAAQKVAFEPFANVEKLEPPESVWLGIQETILAQQEKQNFLVHVWDNIKPILFPKPVFALATVAMLIVAGTALVQLKTGQQANAKENGEYLESLTEVPGALSLNDGKGFETTVEQYFL